jgi:predicted amidohydrolase YtcJ
MHRLQAVLVLLFLLQPTLAQHNFQDLGDNMAPTLPASVYTAKRIITMNPEKPIVEAVAVVGDRILTVGSLEEVKARLGDQSYTLDERFSDDIIVPGFLGQHLHPWLAALTLTAEIIAIEDWVLPDKTVPAVRDRETYLKKLKQADTDLKDPKEPLVTWGYHQYFHGELSRADLDAINKERPILVWHRSCHEFYLNTGAMERYGVDEGWLKQQSAGAQAQSSLEKGHFYEQGVFPLAGKIKPAVAAPERFRKGLEFIKSYLHANGVTVGCEPGGLLSKGLVDFQNKVYGGADTPLRFYFIADGKGLAEKYLAGGDLIAETEKLLTWGEGRTSFMPRKIKLFADGAMYSQAMQMQDGYTDGHDGEWMMDPEFFAEVFRVYWEAGYQIHVHTNGDGGVKMVLDTLETNMRRHPRNDHRTTIIHFGFSKKDQVDRIKNLGAIVSANPYYTVALADRYSKVGIGPERADQMVRLGDVDRAGISYSLHSDMPMAPCQPLFLMHCAVNRKTVSGRVAGPEQRITPEAALRAVTLDAAYSLRLEDEIGSIQSGKRANLTILAEDPLSVPHDKIKDIKVLATVQEGRVLPVK